MFSAQRLKQLSQTLDLKYLDSPFRHGYSPHFPYLEQDQ